MVALDGDDVIWVRGDKSVAEQSLSGQIALFTRAQDGTRSQAGAAFFREGITNFEERPPWIAPNVANAKGVGVVQVVQYRTVERPLFLFITSKVTGLQRFSARVALLPDGAVAVWAPGLEAVVYKADDVRAILNGAHIVSIQDGRFLLSDGTVEDGVIERLENQPQVMAGISRGLGSSLRNEALIAPRSSEGTPSFKYTWQRSNAPVTCVKTIARRAALMQNGNLHQMLPDGATLGEQPSLTDVAGISVGENGFTAVKRDGTLWYSDYDDNGLIPVQVKGAAGVTRAWMASPQDQFENAEVEYFAGVWFATKDGRVFRWGEEVAPTGWAKDLPISITLQARRAGRRTTPRDAGIEFEVDANVNPVEVKDWNHAVAIQSLGTSTVAVLENVSLQAWIPGGYSVMRNAEAKGTFIHVGDIGPRSMEMLDPITDSSETSMLDGTAISGDRNVLSSVERGRRVEGVAADGVSQVLLRLPSYKPGDQVTVKVRSFDCADGKAPPDCTESPYSTDEYGAVGKIGVPWESMNPRQVSSDVATADPKSSGSATGLAFLVYRAPTSFVRRLSGVSATTSVKPDLGKDCPQEYVQADCGQATRDVYIEVTYQSGALKEGFFEPLKVVRPPVVLIHGLTSSGCSWNNFRMAWGEPSFKPSPGLPAWENARRPGDMGPPFRPIVLDYSEEVAISKAEYGELFNVRANVIGVQWNTRRLLPVLRTALSSFKRRERQEIGEIGGCGNSDAAPVSIAAVQADVIGHSMGGLIALAMQRDLSFFSQSDTYGRGYFHKLVTLGTPYLGSPFATRILDGKNECIRLWTAAATTTVDDVSRYIAEAKQKLIGLGLNDFLTSLGLPSSGDAASQAQLAAKSATQSFVWVQPSSEQTHQRGATLDLRGTGTLDGLRDNDLLRWLHKTLPLALPTGMIAGVASRDQFENMDRQKTDAWKTSSVCSGDPQAAYDRLSAGNWWLRRIAGVVDIVRKDSTLLAQFDSALRTRLQGDGDFIAVNFSGQNYMRLLANSPSDGFVTVESALDGVTEKGGAFVIRPGDGGVPKGIAHGVGTVDDIGIGAPHLLEDKRVYNLTLQLLNASPHDPRFFIVRRGIGEVDPLPENMFCASDVKAVLKGLGTAPPDGLNCP